MHQNSDTDGYLGTGSPSGLTITNNIFRVYPFPSSVYNVPVVNFTVITYWSTLLKPNPN